MSLITRLDSQADGFAQRLKALLAYDAAEDESIEQATAAILNRVRQDGDAAVLDYTRQFDSLTVSSMAELRISAEQCQNALNNLPNDVRNALQTAADRIRHYHEHQTTQGWSYTEADGTMLGQKITPIDRVGLYVPGGKAAYPSSVLMNAIPAKVAGVPQLIMVTPTPNGEVNPMVLAAAAISGVDQIWAIGGAQAVAALAYGTNSIPAVDKIVGPGNAYVAAAKRRVFGTVGIDMIAGPSEILIIADGSTPAEWVAMDLFSQAEHDELAQSILLSPDAECLLKVEAATERLLLYMPRAFIIHTRLGNCGALIKVESLDQACEVANQIAAEHLEIMTQNPERL